VGCGHGMRAMGDERDLWDGAHTRSVLLVLLFFFFLFFIFMHFVVISFCVSFFFSFVYFSLFSRLHPLLPPPSHFAFFFANTCWPHMLFCCCRVCSIIHLARLAVGNGGSLQRGAFHCGSR